MKIVLGTPRSGTSFVANWYANELPDHKYMLPEKLGEYFHPDFFASDDVDAETLERISGLPSKCIFKLHTGKEMSKHIWEYISDKPVILVKRKDILGQFISIGVGYTTNKWVNFKAKNTNGLQTGQTFYYKKEWFDDLAERIMSLQSIENTLLLERTIWFEDLDQFKPNGELPTRQNSLPNDVKLQYIENKEEFLSWMKIFEDSNV